MSLHGFNKMFLFDCPVKDFRKCSIGNIFMNFLGLLVFKSHEFKKFELGNF